MKFKQSLVLFFSLIFTTVEHSFASISIGSSRVIFNADEKSISVGIANRSTDKPYLVNVNISNDISGNIKDTPFIATPVLFRVEPSSTNKVRIFKQINKLPTDRESLFYFNTMAIPTSDTGETKQTEAVGGILQIATGNTIKFFYRPNNLVITQKEAMGKINFSHEDKGIKVTNPTPYYISLAKLVVDSKKVSLNVTNGSSMIAPFGSYIYPVNAPRGKKVEWKAINDFGGTENFNGTIN